MTSNARKIWLPLAILVSALVVWTALLALGAYLEWGADQPDRDVRKPLIMLGSLGVFLGVWATAYWLRARRLRQKNRPDNEPPGDSGSTTGIAG